jgi:6-phosphogluconate dehydrogenase
MVHNGIEYGDMQLISEAYDVLKTVGGLSVEELAAVFDEWNASELESFLVEITAAIFKRADDAEGGGGWLVDKVLDKTGMKVRRGGRARVFVWDGAKKGRAPSVAARPQRRKKIDLAFDCWFRTNDLRVMGPARYHCAKSNADVRV